MAVSIEQIKQLRDATGVSMTACKAALEEANGDFDSAVDILRKKGASKAADKASRVTGNGAVFVKKAADKIAMIKILCETDFVAISNDFASLGQAVLDKYVDGQISAADDVAEIKDAVLKLGENVQLAEMVTLEGSSTGSYVHSNKKIGVIVALQGGSEDLAKDVAMHVAALNPKVSSPDEIAQELVDREKAIWTEQLKSENKPAEIIEKIMMGKEKKFREENALLKQAFVKNPDVNVETLLTQGGAKLIKFVRFDV